MRIGLSLCLLFIASQAAALDRSIVNASGLPLPRFVSLKSNEINMRVGPGTQYPIRWTYQKKRLPLEVTEEFGHWRKVRDMQGEQGWIHKNLLSGARTAILTASPSLLYLAPREDAAVVVKAEEGVIVRLSECRANWCEANIAERTGWLRKEDLWGVYESEKFKRD